MLPGAAQHWTEPNLSLKYRRSSHSARFYSLYPRMEGSGDGVGAADKNVKVKRMTFTAEAKWSRPQPLGCQPRLTSTAHTSHILARRAITSSAFVNIGGRARVI